MNKIIIGEPTLPNLQDVYNNLEILWKSKQLSNNGIFLKEFEKQLCDYLDISYISVMTNATSALITAFKLLNITGEVITTPFSFIASGNVLLHLGLTPVFVDIDPKTCTINPYKIEEAITNKTSAIFGVHIYGYPCYVDKIKEIANKYNIKVIYDGAQAFGTKINGKSILSYGDASVVSFHATKVFNTIEGGAVIFNDKNLINKANCFKNFGFDENGEIDDYGLNFKLDEIRASIGLLNLQTIDNEINKRKNIYNIYKANLPNIKILEINDNINYNYNYFPIFVNDRDKIYNKLKENNIISRKYCYPLISDFKPFKKFSNNSLINAKIISDMVICLPINSNMSENEIIKICNIINESFNNR